MNRVVIGIGSNIDPQRNIDVALERIGDMNAPRTIDLDIVVFNGLIVDSDVYKRDFLRTAVSELSPE